jgi:hypothetical protein
LRALSKVREILRAVKSREIPNEKRAGQKGILVLLLFGIGTMLPCIAIALSATNPRVKALFDFLAWGLALCNLCEVFLLARSKH